MSELQRWNLTRHAFIMKKDEYGDWVRHSDAQDAIAAAVKEVGDKFDAELDRLMRDHEDQFETRCKPWDDARKSAEQRIRDLEGALKKARPIIAARLDSEEDEDTLETIDALLAAQTPKEKP